MYIGKQPGQLTHESMDIISANNSKEERWINLKKSMKERCTSSPLYQTQSEKDNDEGGDKKIKAGLKNKMNVSMDQNIVQWARLKPGHAGFST